MKFIKLRKPLNNFAETPKLNEVLKHTEMPQKKEILQLNEVLKVFSKKWKRLKKHRSGSSYKILERGG